MLPGMKSAGVFRDATVSSVELLDSMGCIVVGYSNGKFYRYVKIFSMFYRLKYWEIGSV